MTDGSTRWGAQWTLLLLLGVALGEDDAPSWAVTPAKKSSDGSVEAPFGNVGAYHALLIGIADYKKMQALDTPINDIDRLSTLLARKFGFESVKQLKNAEATEENILKELDQLKSYPPNANILVYFAGHGTYDKDEKEAYWIPYEEEKNIPSAVVKAKLRAARARHVLLVCDSCFGGTFATRYGRATSKQGDRLYKELSKLKSRETITSGGQEEVADKGARDLSFFAHRFVRELEDVDGAYTTSYELFYRVRRSVTNAAGSEQTPRHGRFGDDDGGEFIFSVVDAPVIDTTREDPFDENLPGNVRKIGALYRSSAPDNCEMVAIRGSNDVSYRGSQHDIGDFLIDKYEVTVGRFAEFLKSQDEVAGLRYWAEGGYSDVLQPVVGVSLEHALRFARWAGKELPTEVHWAYAAGFDKATGAMRRYPWGSTFSREIRPSYYPPPVSEQTADTSPWGVVGMGSGVRELCRLPGVRTAALICGGTQIKASRRDSLRDFSAERDGVVEYFRREVDPTVRKSNVGFRCIIRR